MRKYDNMGSWFLPVGSEHARLVPVLLPGLTALNLLVQEDEKVAFGILRFTPKPALLYVVQRVPRRDVPKHSCSKLAVLNP